MKRSMLLASALTLTLALTACQNNRYNDGYGNNGYGNGGYGNSGWGDKQAVGTLGGAALGGLVGNQFGGGTGKAVATAAGVLLGGYLGSQIGAQLDEADRTRMSGAAQKAYVAPIGQQITWNNPQSGNYGAIVPTRDGYANNGSYCREFQQKITVNGQTQTGYGTACRQPDGSWQIGQ